MYITRPVAYRRAVSVLALHRSVNAAEMPSAAIQLRRRQSAEWDGPPVPDLPVLRPLPLRSPALQGEGTQFGQLQRGTPDTAAHVVSPRPRTQKPISDEANVVPSSRRSSRLPRCSRTFSGRLGHPPTSISDAATLCKISFMITSVAGADSPTPLHSCSCTSHLHPLAPAFATPVIRLQSSAGDLGHGQTTSYTDISPHAQHDRWQTSR